MSPDGSKVAPESFDEFQLEHLSGYDELFVKYLVKLKVRDRVLANLPTDFKALKYIAKAQLEKEGRSGTTRDIAERVQELEEELPWGEEEVVQSFLRDREGMFIRERNIKGLLKECARVCRIRGYREAINHGVFVKPEKIYFRRNGKSITKVDGRKETGIRVSGPRGPRSALKIAEYINQPELEFQIWVAGPISRSKLPGTVIREMLEYAQEIGLLGDRALGEGKFDVVESQRIKEN